jgi:hypothetical protein
MLPGVISLETLRRFSLAGRQTPLPTNQTWPEYIFPTPSASIFKVRGHFQRMAQDKNLHRGGRRLGHSGLQRSNAPGENRRHTRYTATLPMRNPPPLAFAPMNSQERSFQEFADFVASLKSGEKSLSLRAAAA